MRWPRWQRHGNLAGHVDGIIDGRLQGWVIDRARPGRPVLVCIKAGELVIHQWADRYRADVQKARAGDGMCGFAVAIGRLRGAALVHVLAEASGRDLPGSPMALGGAPRPLIHLPGAGYAFCLDHDRPEAGLTGYAALTAEPDSRRWLAIEADGAIAVRAHATLHRPDMPPSLPDTLHGFAFPPAAASHFLRLVDIDAGLVLATRTPGGRGRWIAERGLEAVRP